jgi:hypothetical protein
VSRISYTQQYDDIKKKMLRHKAGKFLCLLRASSGEKMLGVVLDVLFARLFEFLNTGDTGHSILLISCISVLSNRDMVEVPLTANQVESM